MNGKIKIEDEIMYTLNIQNDVVYFKDIRVDHLPKILNWYNEVDDFKYATGIDSPFTLQMLNQKYAEVAISKNEFFVGIYAKENTKMIGLLKGRLKFRNKDAVWISSLVVDPMFQNHSFGTESINLLLEYLKINNKIKYAYLSVVEENTRGKNFWIKLDFKELKRIENYFRLHEKQQDVIIMYKRI